MKVAIINSVCSYGSTGEICEKISKRLLQNNIENRIFYGIGSTNYKYATNFSWDFDVKFHQLRTRIFGKHAFYSEFSTYRLVGILKRYNPDIVHLHNLHGHYINTKILFKYLIKYQVKIIWTFHDCWPYTGHCTHYTLVNCYKWMDGCNKCIQKRKYPVSLLFDRSKSAWVDKKELFLNSKNINIVCVSNWLKMQVEQSFFSNNCNLFTIYNSVDTNVFKPKRNLKSTYGLNSKFIALGMYGKWNEAVNNEILQYVIDNLPPDVLLILLGKKDKSLERKNLITFDKIKDRDELADFYNMADVFVNLSCEDSFGLVNIESMACGTPIIVYNSTASPEIVGNDEKCGFIVNVGDKVKLLNSIIKIYKIGKEEFSSNCINRVKKLYNDENNYENYVSLYRRVMK